MTTQTNAQQQEKQAGQLPPAADAFDNLYSGVHQHVFFSTLAGAGIAPMTEKEATDLLTLGGRLRAAEEQEKQAGDSRFSGVLQALDGVLGDQGFNKQAEDYQQGMAIKAAASQMMQDPVIYNSVLSLKAHEAQVMAQQSQG